MVSSSVVDPDPSLFVRFRILPSFKQKQLRKTLIFSILYDLFEE